MDLLSMASASAATSTSSAAAAPDVILGAAEERLGVLSSDASAFGFSAITWDELRGYAALTEAQRSRFVPSSDLIRSCTSNSSKA